MSVATVCRLPHDDLVDDAAYFFVHNPYTSPAATLRSSKPPATPPDSPRQPTYSQRRAERTAAAAELATTSPMGLDQEIELLCTVVGFFDGYEGSLPAERVQNVIKQEHPQLWASVIDGHYHRRWHVFCAVHSDAIRLESQLQPHLSDASWRLRLAGSCDWQAVDRQQEEQRIRSRPVVLGRLCALLQDTRTGSHPTRKKERMRMGPGGARAAPSPSTPPQPT